MEAGTRVNREPRPSDQQSSTVLLTMTMHAHENGLGLEVLCGMLEVVSKGGQAFPPVNLKRTA